jgi:hypothetical protein
MQQQDEQAVLSKTQTTVVTFVHILTPLTLDGKRGT